MRFFLRAAGAASLFCFATLATFADDGAAAPCETCVQQSEWECGCDPVWTVRAGAIFLDRSTPDNRPLIVPIAGPGVISTGSDFDFNWGAGPEVVLARKLDSDNSLEVRYFNVDNSAPTVQYGAVGNVRIGSFSNFGATNLIGNYDTRLYNLEINWLHPSSDRVTILAGFRALQLHDNQTYTITFPAFTADYNFNEDNYLYGAQIGANLALWNLDGPLTINCALKAGIYSNSADNDFTLLPSTGGQFDGGARGSSTAFVGEINFTARYQLKEHIAVYGGYQLLFMQGLSLASDQLARSTAASSQAGISFDGDLFYHGATTGIEFTW